MIEVRVYLHSAVTKESTIIGQTFITNVGGSYTDRNYKVELMKRGDPVGHPSKGTVTRVGEVHRHKALTYPIWVLVAKALASVGFLSDKGAIGCTHGPVECSHEVLKDE